MVDFHADRTNITVCATGPVELQTVEVAEAVHNWVWRLAGGDREKARAARRIVLHILADDEFWEAMCEDAETIDEADSPEVTIDEPGGWWDDMWPTGRESGAQA